MIIALKKGRDGPSTLTCVRADGSRTWHKLHPFFPVHDLTHCAVESVFGFDQAFFGLVASGWPLDGFEDDGAARKLPEQALWAECMVGVFDIERSRPQVMTGAEFSEQLASALTGVGAPAFRAVTDAELERVRALRDDLAARWRALPPGGTFEVAFPVIAAPAPAQADR